MYVEDGMEADKAQALVAFVGWCSSSQGNLAGTISGKLAAVQYCHRVEGHKDLPIAAPSVSRALKGVEKAHVAFGTVRRVRVPVSWEVVLAGQHLARSWGAGGRVLWLCLALTYFLVARSDEIFADGAGRVHPVHCLRRDDVTFYEGERVLRPTQWYRATRVKVVFRGHKGDQVEQGSTLFRTRDVAHGYLSQVGAGGGAVAILVELMSSHFALPGNVPLCSYSSGREGGTRVWGYRKALTALRQVVAASGGDPEQVGLHSLRISAATVLAAGGTIPDRIIEREGRWKEGGGTYKIYTRNNIEDSVIVSRRLARGAVEQKGVTGKGKSVKRAGK